MRSSCSPRGRRTALALVGVAALAVLAVGTALAHGGHAGGTPATPLEPDDGLGWPALAAAGFGGATLLAAVGLTAAGRLSGRGATALFAAGATLLAFAAMRVVGAV